MTANRLLADVTANNIANMRTTRTPEGGPYRRQMVEMTAEPFALPGSRGSARGASAAPGAGGVSARVVEAPGDGKLEYDPSHPDADENGYVRYPDINLAEEIVNLIVAQRAYDASLTAFNTVKAMAQRTLDLGK